MTVRTKTELNTIYADNAAGDISAEDLRDFVDTAIRDTPTAAGASAFGDAASGGTSEELSKVDHKHSREANPVTAHEAAADPHTGYRLESADHSHQTTGLQAGKIDHGAALDGLADDDHAAYLLASDATSRAAFASNWLDLTDGGASALHSHAGGGYTDEEAQDAVGGILVDSTSIDFTYADATPSITATVITGTTAAAIGTSAGGSAATPSKSDHVHATGAGTPSTQAFGDAAATGAGPAAAMTDHKHAMPANPVTAHEAAGDPHTGYRLESADHSHASTGLQGGLLPHTQTLTVWAASIMPTLTSGAATPGIIDSGSSDVGVVVMDFDATSIEYGIFQIAMPDNYDGGTVTAKFSWMTTSTTTTHTCRWVLEGRSYGDGETLDQAYGTSQLIDDDVVNATANQILISGSTPAITLGGTPAAGELVAFRVSRDPTNDDLNVDARLLAVRIEYGVTGLSS